MVEIISLCLVGKVIALLYIRVSQPQGNFHSVISAGSLHRRLELPILNMETLHISDDVFHPLNEVQDFLLMSA